MDVALVVNNAGTGMPGTIMEQDPADVQFEINLNALHPVYHTRAWLKRMQERKNRSGIINVASTMASSKMVANSTYCMTKAFLSMVS